MIDTTFPVLALPKSVPLIGKSSDWQHGYDYDYDSVDSRSSSPRAHGHSCQQIHRALQDDLLEEQQQAIVSQDALQASGGFGPW